jgi:hypothetical protein
MHFWLSLVQIKRYVGHCKQLNSSYNSWCSLYPNWQVFHPPPGIEHYNSDCPARSLVAIPTELPWLSLAFWKLVSTLSNRSEHIKIQFEKDEGLTKVSDKMNRSVNWIWDREETWSVSMKVTDSSPCVGYEHWREGPHAEAAGLSIRLRDSLDHDHGIKRLCTLVLIMHLHEESSS